MEITNDTEYLELLEQLITKEETEYGEGWAKSNPTTGVLVGSNKKSNH
jgi:hypothetical protein